MAAANDTKSRAAATRAAPPYVAPSNCATYRAWAAAQPFGQHATICGQRAAVDRQSGPRPESRHLRQPALEGLTNSARTETPRQADRNKSDHDKRQRTAAAGGGAREEADGVRL
ncbi:hypothetical protein F511_38922 [Dorcoceras hygrometricum]|uniref:Uncharacterized protein n=1 Tax=Dorcoceras hygrometricum TaxID=472368 RepID=A0A2Z7ADL5_9LAMI|nr:hypothetical protein F511_38922 [Dorcoceras hygrometricum]